MFADVDEVLCQRAKWSLRLLVPSWAAYVCILLGLIGLFSHRLAETVNNWEETDKTGDLPEVEMVWEVTNFAFSVIALVLSIFEMTSLRSGMLTPFFMLCSHLIKLTLFLGILGLDVAAVASRIDGLTPAIGLAFGCLQIILGIFTLTYATRVFRDVLRFENKSPASRSVYAELVGHDMMELGAADPSGSRSDRRHSPSAIDNPGTAYRSHTAGPQSGEADEYTGFEFGWGSSRPGDGAAGGSARSAPPELSRDPRSPGLPSPGLSSPGLSSPGLLSPGSPGPSPRGMTKGNGVGRGRRWRHADKSVLARVVPGHGNEQEEADATHDLLLHEKSERASVSTFSQFKD